MKLVKSFLFAAAFLFLGLAIDGGLGLPGARGDETGPATQPDRFDLIVIDGLTQRPVAGARVSVDASPEKERKLATGSDGHVTFALPKRNGFGYFNVSVSATGYVGKYVEWRPGDKDPIPGSYTLVMEHGTKIGGQIVDDAGQPVAGAHIVLWMGRQAASKPHEHVDVDASKIISEEDGRWSFTEAPADFGSVEMGCWDYDFANGDSFPMKSLTAEQLHSGTESYVLQRGVPVTGVVQDESGKPLRGASVITGAQLCSNRIPAQKTGEDGTFHYKAKPGDEVTLTVTRKGFAPELKSFVMGSDKYSLTIQLSKSKPMIGRIVNSRGEAVPFAWVYPDTWRGNRSLDMRIQADKDGRFEWKDAPLDTVYCDVDGTEAGYLRESRVPLTASDKEITVTLRSALSVTGTVVDAQTNAPIESFSVIHGIYFGPNQSISWERDSQNVTKGQSGKFDFHSTWSYPGYAVRIEAAGYQPAESRVFTADEGTVSLELRLNKGVDVTATVLKPDGRPAAGATAVLALGGQSAYLYNCREVREQGCQQATTTADGKFSFPPQIGAFKVVIFSDDGYAETDQDAMAKLGTIRLRAWGTISGVLKIGSKPAAGEQIVVMPKEPMIFDPKASRVYHQIETKTDREGKFVFDRVPPGDGISVAREVMRPMGGGSFMGSYSERQEISVSPGQSVQLPLGGMERPVIGRVVIPPELASQQNWGFGMSCQIMSKVAMPAFPEMPADVKNGSAEQQRKWRVDFMKSDAGRAYIAASQEAQVQRREYPLQISQDGTFRADDVAAGTYTIGVDIAHKNADSTCGTGEAIAQGSAEFTVPEMPDGRSDEPLQIPPISMQVIKTVNVGDAAPDFSGRTFAGSELKLSALRGKYVLLDFWATWCGPCVEEIPSIKAGFESFGRDPRFVMISISLDQKAEDAKGYTAKNGMNWNQIYQDGGWQAPVVQAYCIRSIPSIWLIGPDGKIIAKDLRGEAIKTAVANALQR